MKWISIENKLPERDELVLVYKITDMGGYYKDTIFIAEYQKVYHRFFFIIQDSETNRNNYRPVKEFSHWMPLPNQPERLSEKTLSDKDKDAIV